jgi:hypothetical protein
MLVIYSPGYGAGWSTWGKQESALDQELAQAILDEKSPEEISVIAEKNWPGQYQGGLRQACVVDLPAGIHFRINEYDGFESIEQDTDVTWLVS